MQNFKAWQDTGRIRLAPLTVIFGANSTGKSSLGHWLLALKQTAQSTDRRRALHLGDDRALVDLGTYEDCLHGHDLRRRLKFSLRWRVPSDLVVTDPLTGHSVKGDELELDVALAADDAYQPEVRTLCYRLFEGFTETLSVKLKRKPDGELELKTTGYGLERAVGKPRLDKPEKFYRVSEALLARFQNAGFLSDFALAFEALLERFYYLGPLREVPRRIYQWAGDAPEDLGSRGEYAVAAILAAESQGRTLNLGHRQRRRPFAEIIAGALKQLGVIASFTLEPVAPGRREYEVLVRTHGETSEVKLTDVGFGVSQVLPAVVEAFYCPRIRSFGWSSRKSICIPRYRPIWPMYSSMLSAPVRTVRTETCN